MGKKTLHIIDSLSIGGAQSVLKGIFENQKKNKEILLFSLRNKNTKIEIEHENIFRFASNRKYSFLPLRELRRIIKEEKIEIIHTHLFRSHIFGWILKKFFFPEIKLIFHEHGQIFRNNFHYDFLVKFFLKDVDLIITVSEIAKKLVIQKTKISVDKVLVFYNFVNLKRFDYRLKREIKDKKFKIGFVGRLDVVKRVDFLIQSFALFLESYKDEEYELVLVGAGPEEMTLREMVRELGLEKKIIFAGKQGKVENFLATFDVFVLPSSSEACPMSLLEAFAMKVPAIVSDIPQLEEFSKNPSKALMFDVENKKDLAESFAKVRNESNSMVESVENAYEFAKQNSIENYTKRLFDLYKNT